MSLLPLYSIGPDSSLWGGKAAGAARIQSLDLWVPASLVIGAEYFQQRLRSAGCAVDRWPISESRVRALFEQVWRCIDEVPLDGLFNASDGVDHLLDQVLAATAVVRSSSTLEDGAQGSFAGCYESHFGARDRESLTDLVKRCWKSAYTPSIASYAVARGLAADMGFAVLIQEQIQCEAAGVCFSLDPVTGCEDQWLIEANWGNGLSVVSGDIQVDRYRMDKNHGSIQRELGTKTAYVVFGPNGCLEIPATGEIADQACLEPVHIKAICAAAARLQTAFACHVDIEWGFRDGRLYIFQCRPVTAGRQVL